MSTTKTTTESTKLKFEPVVAQCTTCSHKDICKYKAQCAGIIYDINKKIDELNNFLETETEDQTSQNRLFNFSFESETGSPSIVISCLYFESEEPGDSEEPEEPESEEPESGESE